MGLTPFWKWNCLKEKGHMGGRQKVPEVDPLFGVAVQGFWISKIFMGFLIHLGGFRIELSHVLQAVRKYLKIWKILKIQKC